MKMIIDEKAKYVINTLENSSFEAFVVGGCLRDIMLGKVAHDIDITTNALPNQVIDIFKGKHTVIETGIKYGTVTLIVNDTPIEITTYRSEQSYVDGRHPENVIFEKNIKEDLSRRDFTINAMAYNNSQGLIDLFDGEKDLKNEIIRCVNEPIKRFEEDKLRMLRAVRFASTLDFTMEEKTFEAIRKLSYKINEVSIERINAELTKMLLGDKPSRAIILLRDTGLLQHILPVIYDMYGFDQQNPFHTKDLFFHTMDVLDNTPKDIVLRLSALFHDTGKLMTKSVDENNIGHFYGHNKVSEEIAEQYLRKLRYSNDIIKLVSLLVQKHMIDENHITKKGIRRLISTFGKENINYLVLLQKADSKATTLGNTSLFEQKVNEVLEEENVFSLKDLEIDGNDLIDLGFQGKQIGEVLNYIFDLVLEDPCINKRQELLKIIKDIKNRE